uniref:Uncharacterized protein n=1 Tax=Anguilla anguilla TaxID=7936 RepID=A0A0E9SRN5_ANGAN
MFFLVLSNFFILEITQICALFCFIIARWTPRCISGHRKPRKIFINIPPLAVIQSLSIPVKSSHYCPVQDLSDQITLALRTDFIK